MRESVNWLVFTFFSTLLSFFLFDWIVTMSCLISGFLTALKAFIAEQTKE